MEDTGTWLPFLSSVEGGEGNFMQRGSHIMRPPQTHTMMCLLGGQAMSQAWVFCERCVQMRQMLTSLADVATDASDVDSLADVATHVKALVRDLWQPQDQNVRPKVRSFLIRLSFLFC